MVRICTTCEVFYRDKDLKTEVFEHSGFLEIDAQFEMQMPGNVTYPCKLRDSPLFYHGSSVKKI